MGLPYFDFDRSNHIGGLDVATPVGELTARCHPSAMRHSPAKRRLARHLADQPEPERIVTGRNLDRIPLLLSQNGSWAEESLEYRGTIPQDIASRRSDLFIRVLPQRFLDNIQQASLALERRQESHCVVARRLPGR
jgi:hypothetical protein